MYFPPLVLEFRDTTPPFFVLCLQPSFARLVPVGIVWTELEGDMLHDRARFVRLRRDPGAVWGMKSYEGLEVTFSAPRIEQLLLDVRRYLVREAEDDRLTTRIVL